VTVGETAGLSAKGQLIDVYAGLPLLVRTSREAAAAPSFCSSWRSDSRLPRRGDHRGLCDRHNPGSDVDRDAG